MLFRHCFPWWPRCRPTRNRGPRGGPQASEHERSVAITEGNRTSRVAAEPSAAAYASELRLLHHGLARAAARRSVKVPMPGLKDRRTDPGYALGWLAVRRPPEAWAQLA